MPRPVPPAAGPVDPATVRACRAAILGDRITVAPEVLKERVERVRTAASGLRLGVALTPSLYR